MKKLFALPTAFLLVLMLLPSGAMAQDPQSALKEVEDNIQTDISDLTNEGYDPGSADITDTEEDGIQGESLTEDILAVLNDSVYSDTLSALQQGEVMTQGATGETAKGLQKTLTDFGCDIDIDGTAGSATFGALGDVLASFGMEKTDKVDAQVYEKLLELLLITSHEDEARQLLSGQFTDGKDSSEFDYLLGCALYLQGKYYSAREAFESSLYNDYQERSEACVQPWPENGELWHNENYYSEDMYLTFQVNSWSDTIGRFFKVYAEDGTLASTMFITGSGSVTTSLPGGVYRILDATGESWYGDIEAFGPDGYYEYMVFEEFDDDQYKTLLESGYEWTISVNVSDTEGTGIGSETFDWDSWTES